MLPHPPGAVCFLRIPVEPGQLADPAVERVARTLVFAGVDALPPLLLTGAGLGELARRYGSLGSNPGEAAT